jgi:predicted homoserine dehydrogenase-like protein
MITKKLKQRAEEGNPIKIGWVGAGRMNTGAICQCAQMRGMSNSVICDINEQAAIRAFEVNEVSKSEIVVSNSLGKLQDAIQHGKPAVTTEANLLPQLELDCVVEGTGNPEVGALVAYRCIETGRHIVMLNVETDVIIGPLLHRMAERTGAIYTVSSGDEPGLITELVDRWGGLGLEIAAVGKSPSVLAIMNRYTNPDIVAEDAKRTGISPHFLVTFRDASKTAIEMACISNATGLIPDVRGMHGPTAGVKEVAEIFKLKEDGGVLNKLGAVDYACPLKLKDGSIDFPNSVTPGVFVVVRAPHPQIKADLGYFDVVSSGDYFTLYMPYHLVTTEIPLSIVWAVEDHEPTVVASAGHVSEVIAAAKKDLKAGSEIDGPGGFTIYASIDKAAIAKKERLVPYGLLSGAKLKKDVPKDGFITYDDVELNSDSFIYHLRQIQERIIPPLEE